MRSPTISAMGPDSLRRGGRPALSPCKRGRERSSHLQIVRDAHLAWSESGNIDHGLSEGLRRLLRQVMADTAGDETVLVLA
jgi:hypothetical protein